jgi:membrane protease YdiL (CAAX protease family)
MKPRQRSFDPLLAKGEAAAGFFYLPLHILVLPLLIPLAATYFPSLTEGQSNLIYYGIGVLFLGLFFLPYLRRQFDALLDRPLDALVALAGAFLLDLILSYAAAYLIYFLYGDAAVNPNNENLFPYVGKDFSIIRALAIYIAPVLEETLFRGVLFGSLRRRNRLLAYAVSVILFSLYHVWQYAAAGMDPTLLGYALQYIPVSIALCWCFERSGSLWAPIALHIGINALAFAALPYLM